MVMFMGHMPAPVGDGTQSGRDLCRLGRHRLYTTPFEDYENEIRKQLAGMFGQYGFDPDRDIGAITINRWSHGYAYEYMELFDPEWKEGEAPHELGRKPIGRISIANSDSEACWGASLLVESVLPIPTPRPMPMCNRLSMRQCGR